MQCGEVKNHQDGREELKKGFKGMFPLGCLPPKERGSPPLNCNGDYRIRYVMVTVAVTVTSPGWMGVGAAADFMAAPSYW